MINVVVRLPSKLILAGEHSVCYDQAAIVVAIKDPYLQLKFALVNKHDTIKVELDNNRAEKALKQICDDLKFDRACINLQIESTVPFGSGFGSSASFCVGCVVAITVLTETKVDLDKIFQVARNAEQIFHGGRSSGVDIVPYIHGGICRYDMAQGVIDKMKSDFFNFKILIADTRIQRDTSKLNKILEMKFKLQKQSTDLIIKTLGSVTNDMWTNLQGDKDYNMLKDHCYQCHCLLKALGLSHPKLDLAVKIAEDYDIAAKMTGAGGGGCAIMFIDPSIHDKDKLCKQLRDNDFRVYDNVELTNIGYTVEKYFPAEH
ncbi:hypothetical protein GJ496_000773 [Pomphorhynchus laevis]|nr:hypothetical protein GJ496_000773 [Pomphorhynchus laevis]